VATSAAKSASCGKRGLTHAVTVPVDSLIRVTASPLLPSVTGFIFVLLGFSALSFGCDK
jgi:hypothetical protein